MNEPVYAWQDADTEADLPESPVAERRWWPGDTLVAAAVIAAIAIAATIVGIFAVEYRAPAPERYGAIAEAPIELPPPAPKPIAPPVAAPPVEHMAPPVQAPPPDAAGKFSDSLKQGGMWPKAGDDQQARNLCADLANGESPDEYVRGTMRKSPQLTPAEAAQVVRDAIRAYCPQFGGP
jgi:hypothetical protein